MPQTRYAGLCNEARKKVQSLKKRMSNDRYVIGFDCDFLYLANFVDEHGILQYREIEQLSVWMDGPCIFTCLEDEEGTLIGEWSFSEIDTDVDYETAHISNKFNTKKDEEND